MNRRTFAASLASAALMKGAAPRTTMGVAETSFNLSNPKDTLALLELAHKLGAAGLQATLTSKDPAYLHKLRDRAGQLGMYLETIAPFPKTPKDLPAFDASLAAAKEAGAVAVRTATDGGRRYEKWTTPEAWAAFLKDTSAGVQVIAKAAETAKIPVGLENHKDYTLEELLGAMKRLGGEYFGVTLDFGNIIRSDADMTADVVLRDMTGRLVSTGAIQIRSGTQQQQIDMSSLSQGVYILSLSHSGETLASIKALVIK